MHLVNPICNILVSIMKSIVLIIICILLTSCDGGLAPPPPVELGFSGTVYFTPGSWPPADSLVSHYGFLLQRFTRSILQQCMQDYFQIHPQSFFIPV